MLKFSDDQTARLRTRFPSDAESRALRWWSLLFPTFSPGLTALLAVYQLLLLYFLHSVSRLTHLLQPAGPAPWLDNLKNTPLSLGALPGQLVYAAEIALADGMTVLYAFIMIGGCIAFARSGRADARSKVDWLVAGPVHGFLQLVVGLVCCWLAARLTPTFGDGGLGFLVRFTAMAAAFIFIVNGILFGAYLLVVNLTWGMHEQEVFSCQAIEEYKCFLRICVEKDRAMVYPIGLRRPAQSWKAAPGVKVKSSIVWPNLTRKDVLEVPAHSTRIYDPVRPLSPELIEAPIEVS